MIGSVFQRADVRETVKRCQQSLVLFREMESGKMSDILAVERASRYDRDTEFDRHSLAERDVVSMSVFPDVHQEEVCALRLNEVEPDVPETAAEQIGKKYVYSAKASAATVALNNMNDDVVRQELKKITDACYRNNCNFELILKDVSTVSYHPEHLERWEKIAREFIPED